MTRQHALVSIHIAAVLFGLTGIFGELIQANALVITAGRAAFAVAALYAFMRWQGSSARAGLDGRSAAVLTIAGIMLAIHWITFFIAVKVGGVAIATLGFASFPAFITLCEWLVLRERVSSAEWVILALVTVGLVLVTPSFDFRDQATVGLAWAVASGLSFALFTLINRRAAAHISAYQVACWENLVVVLVTLPFGLGSLGEPGLLDWFWLALLGIFCTALSHFLLVSSLMVLKARSAGIVIALEPVYAIAFAAILFAQYPSLRALVGGAIMIGAIVWSGLRKA
ncbi:EamA family transporter [Yanghanlia caeni]|uniref:DMT family transporter n=1 Tax=Yanghanlia caeni TaxID=3064283 RepID=A0ABU1D5F7_9BURK|nr:DMT family transporter [Alcaligenaceae bacterium LG-2]NGR07350.1 DMT family transporter [bacterium SGD-2]HZH56544.1 DMT family transporter [Burkholderiaceae bacterium]